MKQASLFSFFGSLPKQSNARMTQSPSRVTEKSSPVHHSPQQEGITAEKHEDETNEIKEEGCEAKKNDNKCFPEIGKCSTRNEQGEHLHTIVSDDERAAVLSPKKKEQKLIDRKSSGIRVENHIQDDNQISEYEKLRLRNIKRNNERLVALGLAGPSTILPKNSSRPKKRRKPGNIKIPSTGEKLPLRRSTRNKNIPLDTEVDTDVDRLQDKLVVKQVPKEEKEEEQFQDSPLVQYSIGSSSITKSISLQFQHTEELTSFSPRGPRLSPPKANLALYSLDMFAAQQDSPIDWIVGAGKSGIVSIWNCSNCETSSDIELDPIISWKGHGGRWIADAVFMPSRGNLNDSSSRNNNSPFHLLTAANDGKLCLWDLTSSSCRTGSPRNLSMTGKNLHSGGIFSMHTNMKGNNYCDIHVCSGSKDKTIAVSTLESISTGEACRPIFLSRHHSAKVGCVRFKGHGSSLIGSASDDGSIAVHDFRNQMAVADIDFAHDKPHSFVWDDSNAHNFITAGHDPTIHSWDLRSLKKPIASYHGHVPLTSKNCKKIHRPHFLRTSNRDDHKYILTGSEKSRCLSIYKANSILNEEINLSQKAVYSRGRLPNNCGDAGCIAVCGQYVAVAVDGGQVLILEPTRGPN